MGALTEILKKDFANVQLPPEFKFTVSTKFKKKGIETWTLWRESASLLLSFAAWIKNYGKLVINEGIIVGKVFNIDWRTIEQKII